MNHADATLEALKCLVEGRVQRVGFRRHVEEGARIHNIKGYVENIRGGRVAILAQGDPKQLKSFLLFVKNAPKPIVIERVITQKARMNRKLENFEIRAGSTAMEIMEGFGAMETEFKDYRNEFKDYRTEFKDYRNEFKDYRTEFKGFANRTDQNFQTMNDKYGEISAKLTNIMDSMQKNYETYQRESQESREELKRSVDNLVRLIDQYIEKLNGRA